MTRRAQRRRTLRWLVPTLSMLVTLLATEGVLRGIGYTGTRDFRWAVFDEEYGQVDRDEIPWLRQITSRSFAQPALHIWEEDVRVEVPAGKTRILFVGDSDTYGAGFATRRDAFPHRFVEVLPNDTRNRIDVVNAGIPGMTSIGELNLLRNGLLKLKPTIVVLGFFMANDLNINLRHARGPDGAPVGFQILSSLRSGSYLVRASTPPLMTLNPADNPFHEWPGYMRRRRSDYIEHGFNIFHIYEGEFVQYVKDHGPLVHRMFDVQQQVFRDFRALAAANHFQLVVLILPSYSNITRRLFPLIRDHLRRRGIDPPDAELDFTWPLEQIHQLCDAVGLLCIDPTENLRAVANPGSLFHARDHHAGPAVQIFVEALRRNFDTERLRFVCGSLPAASPIR